MADKTVSQRSKDGDEHDPRSIKMYEFISQLDFNECNDSFGFQSGGDGDNGEHLMYLMDVYYANIDSGNVAANDDGSDE